MPGRKGAGVDTFFLEVADAIIPRVVMTRRGDQYSAQRYMKNLTLVLRLTFQRLTSNDLLI